MPVEGFDHVAITVAHTNVQKDGSVVVVPGARDQGPTIDVKCGTPAGGSAHDPDGLPDLGALRDNNAKPFTDPQFARTPCADFHHESQLLWFSNIGLYAATMAAVGWVGWRRLRSRVPLHGRATA